MTTPVNGNPPSIFSHLSTQPKQHPNHGEIVKLIKKLMSECNQKTDVEKFTAFAREDVFKAVYTTIKHKYKQTTLPQIILAFESTFGKDMKSIKQEWVDERHTLHKKFIDDCYMSLY